MMPGPETANAPAADDAAANSQPRLSIVAPALDEADNLAALVDQVDAAVRRAAGVDAELIVVDDGSTDATPTLLRELMATRPWLRTVRHEQPSGQSAAMLSGIAAARGRYVATIDADLQNDPADLPLMLARCEAGEADMVQGDRSANRRDTIVRRYGSAVGRGFRRGLLGDTVRDTGCSARVVRADIAKAFPLYFKGMHRFMPAYAKMLGARIVEMPVRHRPRGAGVPKYGMGVFTRALPGLFDCLAVRWMIKRHRRGRVAP